MKRLFALSTLAAALALTARAPAQADQKSDTVGTRQAAGEQQAPDDAPVERLRTAEGVISGVDQDEVELRTNESTLDFELDSSVPIYRDGKRVPREAIHLGDRARATYQQRIEGVMDDEELVRLDLESNTAR